jgi:hypothetical protein
MPRVPPVTTFVPRLLSSEPRGSRHRTGSRASSR